MKPFLSFSVASAAVALAVCSCTPWAGDAPPPPHSPDAAYRRSTEDANLKKEEQERQIQERRERQAKKNEQDQGRNNGQTAGTPSTEGDPGPQLPPPPKPEAAPKKPAERFPVAVKVPGRPGHVFSPYNNQIIDVSDKESGKKVGDPSYPVSERKFFIVP